MDLDALAASASATLLAAAWKVASALALWLVGRWLISFALDLIARASVSDLPASVQGRRLRDGGRRHRQRRLDRAFWTVINTPDNVCTIVGNNKIFADNIQNLSVNPYRRVDLTVTIGNSVDHRHAIHSIKQRLMTIPNVLSSPPPDVDVLAFTPQLCVRPYCSNQHYWQVYFDTTRLTREAFTEAGFPVPMPAYAVNGGVAGACADAARPGSGDTSHQGLGGFAS